MSVVLSRQSSFDFKWEVIVHLKQGIEELVVLLLPAPVIKYRNKQQSIELSQVEASSPGEVGIDDDSGEAETSESPCPF